MSGTVAFFKAMASVVIANVSPTPKRASYLWLLILVFGIKVNAASH